MFEGAQRGAGVRVAVRNSGGPGGLGPRPVSWTELLHSRPRPTPSYFFSCWLSLPNAVLRADPTHRTKSRPERQCTARGCVDVTSALPKQAKLASCSAAEQTTQSIRSLFFYFISGQITESRERRMHTHTHEDTQGPFMLLSFVPLRTDSSEG